MRVSNLSDSVNAYKGSVSLCHRAQYDAVFSLLDCYCFSSQPALLLLELKR